MASVARVDQLEVAAAVIQPYFDAVRDMFVEHRPTRGHGGLELLRRVKYVVDPKIHNSPRHFAATRDDARLMLFAPQIVDLPFETLVAIVVHEFGHAADFAYPAQWLTPDRPGIASWLGRPEDRPDREQKATKKWGAVWRHRNRQQIEWAADGIAEAVTGKPIGYCEIDGEGCLLQCFAGGIDRPKELR